mmetsp:Transcript_11560/g.18556  ORF Transcript_11560/g.18556 Transcript_11560/m.18556 type:complete len:96 (-) Transcript_11560:2082-2369(-)
MSWVTVIRRGIYWYCSNKILGKHLSGTATTQTINEFQVLAAKSAGCMFVLSIAPSPNDIPFLLQRLYGGGGGRWYGYCCPGYWGGGPGGGGGRFP